MKCLLLLLDGLGDRGQPLFEGRTPLWSARTPNLDRLASLAATGLFHPLSQGVPLPSEVAHFLLFGYSLEEFPGRGALEAIGGGIKLEESEVAILARLVNVIPRERHLILQHDSPDLSPEELKALASAISSFSQEGVEIRFFLLQGPSGVLTLKGDVSHHLTDSNPIYPGRPLLEIRPLKTEAQRTARVLNKYLIWCHRVLEAHPVNQERYSLGLATANALATQRAGRLRPVTPFVQKWGLKGAFIGTGSVYQGLTKLLGMEMILDRDTKDPENDLRRRLSKALDLKGFDFVHVHTKAPDEAAHTKDPKEKLKVIEALDRALTPLLNFWEKERDELLVITADHSTPSSGAMIHSGESVPLLMLNRHTRRDNVRRFNEIDCASGALGQVRGKELMALVLNFLDRGKLFGLRDSPIDQPYFPGPGYPIKIS